MKKTINQNDADIRLGQVLHSAIRMYINGHGENIGTYFHNRWMHYKDWRLDYKDGEDWTYLHRIGVNLAINFPMTFHAQRIDIVMNEERLLFMGDRIITRQPDLIGNKDNNLVIIDFKYTTKPRTQESVDTDEQLSEYAMIACQTFSETPPIHVGICNLQKTTGKVKWVYSTRDKEQIEDKYKRMFSGRKDLDSVFELPEL